MIPLRKLKYGQYFTLSKVEYPTERQVWIRDEYDREDKKYLCYNFADTSKYKYIAGDRKVYSSYEFYI